MRTLLLPIVREFRLRTPLALSQSVLSDERYLKLLYRYKLGRRLNLEDPKDFNEKLQWLKLNDRRPEYVKFVDKLAVKDYVASKIGGEHIIPTLDSWDTPDDIDWDSLPDSFVLKTTHGGGSHGVIICKDKSGLDVKSAVRNLKKAYKRDLYKRFVEWPYKDVPKKVFAEQLVGNFNEPLNDYKFFCFNGKPEGLFVVSDRFGGHHFNYFDIDFNPLDVENMRGSRNPEPIARPKNYDEMLKLAAILSEGLPHVRVDFYDIDGKIYFGELTLYNCSGFNRWSSQDVLDHYGDLIDLPKA